MNIYSLLICGGIADVNHYDEFWNDTACMWELLQRKVEKNGLGVKDENIIVFYGNGVDFSDSEGNMTKYCYKRPLNRNIVKGSLREPVSGKLTEKLSGKLAGRLSQRLPERLPLLRRPLTDYAATSDNIERVLNSLSSTNDIDLLFIWTFGHGFRDENNSYLLLADGSKLYDYRLAELLENINCTTRIICMQQCFSGGFIDNLKKDGNRNTKNRNIILTSCSDFASAYPTNDNVEEDRENGVLYSHGEFNYHLYNALSSKKFNTEALIPGDHRKACEMMFEVYKYISDNDNIDEESTQYYDSENGYWNEGPELIDYLRSRWTFSWNGGNNEECGPIIEFSYPLTEMYRAAKNKQVYLSIEGKMVHNFNLNNSEYRVIIKNPDKFSLDGYFTADFDNKKITYTGKVYSRSSRPYCIGYEPEPTDKSYCESDKESHEWKIVVFNWF
ncbi:C13 family peptidase [Pseudobacteroides cellulosolvens]|uniref:Peptidase C14 caspase catalytic subunit p20 n=1 Tax=Pseudobacteroides cellulosolvens ATCC 35603 = DSM 2933 TaxID=398512 RepID=A0A0L6JI22_9FIRM|nr:C13 family peptidase [Pseudobacteroides cellulosolvens]KNY25360.1 peptidase C14 caspase catalytic subunit p20 [Pseudobacteroides cellulosolvens ATCC 35603 = DSM 2933]